MILAMAGLPGTGKSTLARALAEVLGAVVLDKDRVRAALFGPSHVEYSVAQDDFCADVTYRTTRWLLDRDPATVVILDGRTYTRACQVATLRRELGRCAAPLHLVECVCDPSTALARIRSDRTTGRHPAADRDETLYHRLRARAEPIPAPALVVDTTRPLADCVSACLEHLRAHGWTGGAQRA